MIYGSVCSGIEAASVAWEELGWRAAWFAEIEAGDREGLIERAFQCPGIPQVVAMRGWEWARNYVVDLHKRFRRNRRGQPYRMAS